jgi:hypothetical protein
MSESSKTNISLPNIFIDTEGYPSEEYLQFIRDFKIDTMPILDFVHMVCENWNHGSMGYKLSKKYKGRHKLVLRTLGWSGNEEVINEITNNLVLTNYLMIFVQWKIGGHYYFEIPIRENKKQSDERKTT